MSSQRRKSCRIAAQIAGSGAGSVAGSVADRDEVVDLDHTDDETDTDTDDTEGSLDDFIASSSGEEEDEQALVLARQYYHGTSQGNHLEAEGIASEIDELWDAFDAKTLTQREIEQLLRLMRTLEVRYGVRDPEYLACVLRVEQSLAT